MNQVYRVIKGKAVWCGRQKLRHRADHLAKMPAVPVARVDKRGFWYGTLAIAVAFSSGCSYLKETVRPLSEYQHLSHVTQHVGNNTSNLGYDIYSVGVRWRPTAGITVDLMEGYSKQLMHNRHEVFTGRVTIEFGAKENN